MSAFHPRTHRAICGVVAIAISTFTLVQALQPPTESGRFDRLVIFDPSVVVKPETAKANDATLPSALRGRWSAFAVGSGKTWDITLDTRSGAPMLVEGEGIPMIPGPGNSLRAAAPVTLDSLAAMLRGFVSENAALSLTATAELTLNREGSGQLTPNLWKVTFDRTVGDVPVAGDRWIFYVGHGNLIAFGATRWCSITSTTAPALSPENARTVLFEYMGLGEADRVSVVEEPALQIIPMAAEGTANDAYAGSVGGGYTNALAWRMVVEVAGERGQWSALVDAQSGRILHFEDTVKYAQAKGGVLPLTGDGLCPSGCEQQNYPMPYADIISGSGSTADRMGFFTCTPGGNAFTTLAGPYVRIVDTCGAINEFVACDSDLNLGVSPGTDCNVAPGASPGNTRPARSAYYHLNRIKEHAKVWLPSNNWLPLQLRANVNTNATCDAHWDSVNGTVNFHRSGNGCGNTGEIAAIYYHEWGHGLDQNDGGGFDSPEEGYSDVAAIMITHQSCIGRGFFIDGSTCDYCLSCTGVRDQDWDMRSTHFPLTPENLPLFNCPAGTAPCGLSRYCEGYLVGETVYDLAVRDLPASGLDQATSWQILDRLWWASRLGSGGRAYNCGEIVKTRSCAANSWYTGFRAVDDDDGNLANGTPHAAAIFAAFNRHGIPCGAAADSKNQSTTTCPALPAPVVTATPSSGQVALSWTPVPGAASYNVLRNDLECDWAHTLVANVSGTSYADTGLPNLFPLYYRIQPVGANPSCVGAVSACTTASATNTCTGGGSPSEVTDFNFSSRTNRSWTASATTAPPVTYDVARGTLGEWPVGSGASESCQVPATPDTFVDLADDPEADTGYWYLVRTRNACGIGTYGHASDSSERITAICP